MAEFYGRRIVYTADNEMSDCLRCDNCDKDFNCEKFCGANHGRYGYKRTVWIDDIATQMKGGAE